LPVPVILKRFLAPLLVFILGILLSWRLRSGPRPAATEARQSISAAPKWPEGGMLSCGNRKIKSMKAATACPAGRLSGDLYERFPPLATGPPQLRYLEFAAQDAGQTLAPASSQDSHADLELYMS
jgi:hypothetical protein